MLDPVHSLGALMPLGVIPGGSPYVAQFARPLLQLGPYAPLQGAANSLVLAGYGNSVVWDLPGTPQALYPCYGPGPTFDYLLSYVAPTHNSVLTGGRTSSDCDRVGIFLSTVSGASGVFGVLSGGTNASLVTFSVNQTDNEIATAPGPHNSAPTTQFYARFPAGCACGSRGGRPFSHCPQGPSLWWRPPKARCLRQGPTQPWWPLASSTHKRPRPLRSASRRACLRWARAKLSTRASAVPFSRAAMPTGSACATLPVSAATPPHAPNRGAACAPAPACALRAPPPAL